MASHFVDIEKYICKELFSSKEKPRDYLGCSLIGHPCDRLLWYQYKGIEAPLPRMDSGEDINKLLKKLLRFKLGHLIEDLIITYLNNVGCEVSSQQTEVSFLNGKVKGHIDGIVQEDQAENIKLPLLLEIKSMNDQRFKLLNKKRVKEAFPDYWAQCQLYMKGTRCNRAVFLSFNKNTCELYKEIISYNEKDAEGLLLKAQRIFEYDSEPSIFTQPGRKVPLVCSGCDYFDHCYKETIENETNHDISA
jgi:hypothetical protein